MARLIFRHLAQTALAVWALASAVFLLSRHDLGAAAQLASAEATELTGAPATTPAAARAAQETALHRFGLDLPLFYASSGPVSGAGPRQWRWNGTRNQYHRWALDLLHGDLGTSFRTGQPVGARLRYALSFTLPLTSTAAALAALLALALAQRLATQPWWHKPARTALATAHALPLFVVALVLLLVFANPEVVAWFPAYGLDQPTEADVGAGSRLLTYLAHMALPVAALTLTAIPGLVLQLDAALARELRTDYATTARAKGLSEPAVIRGHALRNALLPAITEFTELLPALVAGAVVVEVVFALPGMGRLLAEAAATRDYPVLVGGVFLTGAARLLALLLADILSLWADPRIRWQA